MSFRRFLLVVTVFLLVFPSFGLVHLGFGETSENVIVFSESDARLAIVAAEERIVVCYRAVAEADKAGANVTGLLAVMNEAGWLLSKAKVAFQIGDFESARDFAVQSQGRLNRFVEEADGLRGTALQQRYWDFMVNVVGSIIGTVAVIGGSFVVWHLLKKRYVKAGSVV
jgi:hypothetical protein